MKTRVLAFFLLCWSWIFAEKPLRFQDIAGVMQQFFHYHIENKQLSPKLIQRSFRIYIENFDPEKSYFYLSEVKSYFEMSEEQARRIMSRIQKGDFSDFQRLEGLIQRAILRNRRLRNQLMQEQKNILQIDFTPLVLASYFPEKEEDLKKQIQIRMNRFLQNYQKALTINSAEQKSKILQFYWKKVQKQESDYLEKAEGGEEISSLRKEHFITLRILKAFAKGLDAHTSFFSREEAQEMRLSLEKQFEGIGIVISEGVEGFIISNILPNSPADKSQSLSINDTLIEINGKSIEGFSLEEVMQELSQKGRKITLGVKKNGKSTIERVSLEKAPIVMEQERLKYTCVPYEEGVIAILTLPSFYESSQGITSEKDMKRALQEIQKQAPIKGVILDFRDNPGGFLTQAVKVAGIFISSGVVVISKYGKEETHYLRKLNTHAYYSGPLIVLTSKLSASAAEIVAQALQDYGAAIVVGDKRTFGKGSIQYQTVTDKHAEHFFKVTVGRYYTVSGRSTQVEGVLADIIVPSILAPFNIGERFLEYPLPPDQVESAYVDSLKDLDEKAKRWFQSNYLPFLQKKMVIWKKMLPTLSQRSGERLQKNLKFQKLLQMQKEIRKKILAKEPLPVDLFSSFPKTDFQKEEAIHIIQDMIQLQKRQAASFQSSKKNQLEAA